MKKHREYRRFCSKCGGRHVKPTGLKCHRHNITTCDVTMSSPVGNVSEIPGSTSHGMATTTVATTKTSVCCSAPTMTTTTTSSAGTSTTMSRSISAASNVGCTLQTLVAVISSMSARMDAMESAITAQAAAPPVARPPPVPAPPVPAPPVPVPSLSLQPGIAPASGPAPNVHTPSPPHVPASQHQPQPTPLLPQLQQQHGHVFHAANQGPSSQAIAARVGQELAVLDGSSTDSVDPRPQSSQTVINSNPGAAGHRRT